MAGRSMVLARRRIQDGEWSLTIGIPSGSALEAHDIHPLTGGSSVWWLDSPTAGESLMSRLEDILDVHAHAATFTCTFDLDTGKVTLASNGETFSITWGSTALRDWLGYTGNLSGANTYTSTNPCQGAVWVGSGRAEFDGEWQAETSDAEVVAQAGPPAGVGSGQFREFADWAFHWEPPALVTSPYLKSGTRDLAGTQVPWTWRDLWQHCRQFHGPIRFYEDRSAGIASFENGWDLYLTGMTKFEPTRKISGVATHYRVAMRVRRYVTA